MPRSTGEMTYFSQAQVAAMWGIRLGRSTAQRLRLYCAQVRGSRMLEATVVTPVRSEAQVRES